jgi:urease accessory protein
MSHPIDPRQSSVLDARFAAESGRTRLDRVFERGALRLRLPRGPRCEGIIVNTGGGILGGDHVRLALHLDAGASVTMTTVAAEKVYRTDGPTSAIEATVHLDAGAALDWLPQETILFDGARLTRSFRIEMALDARLLAAETMIFGRLASQEPTTTGQMSDRWRIRRGGKLVFADESRIDGAIGATLDRPAVAAGARAAALLLFVAPDAEAVVDRLRTATDAFITNEVETRVEIGISARDGVLTARFLARAPDRLTLALATALTAMRSEPLPRSWT